MVKKKLPKFVKQKLPDELLEKERKKRTSAPVKLSTSKSTSTGSTKQVKVKGVKMPKISTKSKKKRKKATSKTQKLRRNVQATIRRAEKKGIRFSDSFKASISKAKYQTLASLQRNKYEKLYAQGTALSPTGEVISGTQARVILRSESAKRAAETRRVNKLLKDTTPEGQRAQRLLDETEEPYHEEETFENEEGFEEEERKRREDWEHNKDNPKFREAVNIGEAMYQNIRDVIDRYSNLGAGNFGMYYTALMDYYINKYGYDFIRAAISTIAQEEFDDKVHDVLFYSGNLENLAKSVDALSELLERALLYSGLTPDFQWDKSFDQMKQEDFSPFSQEEYYPY